MKVSLTKTFTIELNEEEATILCALLGGVRLHVNKPPLPLSQLFYALDEHLPDRTSVFGDYFTGEIHPK